LLGLWGIGDDKNAGVNNNEDMTQFTGYSKLVKSAHQQKNASSNTNTTSRGEDSSNCYTDGDDDDDSSSTEYEVGLESDDINSDEDDDRYG
jgi:hypothetical protein